MATKWVTMEGVLEYAQVFEDNRDMGGDGNDAAKKVASVGGRYKVNFYPKDDTEAQKMWDAGMPESMLGYDTYKKGNPEYGTGKYFSLKRDHEGKYEESSGAPEVVWWTGDGDAKPWDREEDGNIGNGTTGKVKATVWKKTPNDKSAIVGLVKIGVIDHVPYEAGNGDGF